MDSVCSVNITKHYGIKKMEVLNIIEQEDGGAIYQFELTAEESEALCRNGILWAIVCGCTGLTVEKAMNDYLEQKKIDDELLKQYEDAVKDEE